MEDSIIQIECLTGICQTSFFQLYDVKICFRILIIYNNAMREAKEIYDYRKL